MTISAYVLDKHTIKQTDFSNPIAIREEMVQHPEESLWIHGDEPEDIFPLQGIFGLHPLSVEAVTHQNQPSKIEEYDEYLFTIIDGVRYDEKEQEQQQTINNKNEYDKYNPNPNPNLRLIEDDFYIFFERRWIITINFHNQKFQENVRRIKNLQQQLMKIPESKPQPPDNKNDRKGQMTPQMCEVIYCLAIEESIASYYPIVDKTNKQLEQIEESILNASISKTHLSNIISLRRKISFLEGTLGMVSRAFDDIISSSGGGSLEQTKISRDSRRQIRSLNDKVTYLRRDIENMHQRVIGLREAYNSSLTANLNETIRTLTVIATIVLPLTLISGIYGMNFDVMPELRSPYGYYFALSLMAAVGGGMIGYFKWKRWI